MPLTIKRLEPAATVPVSITHPQLTYSRSDAVVELGGEVQVLFPAVDKSVVLLVREDRNLEIRPDNLQARRIFLKGIVRGPALVVPISNWRSAA